MSSSLWPDDPVAGRLRKGGQSRASVLANLRAVLEQKEPGCSCRPRGRWCVGRRQRRREKNRDRGKVLGSEHTQHGQKVQRTALLRKSIENVRKFQESRLQRTNTCLTRRFKGNTPLSRKTSEGLSTGHIPAKCRISKHKHLYGQLPRSLSGEPPREREEQAGFDATVPGDHRAPVLGAGPPGLVVGVGTEDSPAQAGLQGAAHHRLF